MAGFVQGAKDFDSMMNTRLFGGQPNFRPDYVDQSQPQAGSQGGSMPNANVGFQSLMGMLGNAHEAGRRAQSGQAFGNQAMSHGYDNFGPQMQGAMGQIGSVLQGNADRAGDNRTQLRQSAAALGMLPFDLAPDDGGQLASGGAPKWFDDWINMNQRVNDTRNKAMADNPMMQQRMQFANKLIETLFGGQGSGQLQLTGPGTQYGYNGRPSFTTNFGASGGFF